jgi:hypothetical protein
LIDVSAKIFEQATHHFQVPVLGSGKEG